MEALFDLLSKNQQDPTEHDAKKLADSFKLSLSDTENLLKYVGLFKITSGEKNVNSDDTKKLE